MAATPTTEGTRIHTGSSDNQYLDAIVIDHPDRDAQNFCNRYVGSTFTALDELGADIVYTTWPFEISQHVRDDSGANEIQIVAANAVDGMPDIVADIEQLQSDRTKQMTVTIRQYAQVEGSSPIWDIPVVFSVVRVLVSAETTTFSCSRYNVVNRAFPRKVYTVEEFPALRR